MLVIRAALARSPEASTSRDNLLREKTGNTDVPETGNAHLMLQQEGAPRLQEAAL
jgi:hypothetical protein